MFPVDIETLPQDLQRNFTVMRTLDQKTEDIKTEIDCCSQKYCQEVGRMSEGERGQLRVGDHSGDVQEGH